MRSVELTIQSATPACWPALEDLFGDKGACGGCWCMYWRIGNAYRRRPQEANRRALYNVVTQGPPPGLLAFDGQVAVGWCQLTPRIKLPWLDRAWQRIDEVPVWSISCFYIRKGYRRRGITSALIDAAIQAARKAGAPALEAYPHSMENYLPVLQALATFQLFSEQVLGLLAAALARVRSCVWIFDPNENLENPSSIVRSNSRRPASIRTNIG